jgi:hypothetical protein
VAVMADNRPRDCTRCVAEVDSGERIPGMVGREYLPCEACGEPACLDHAREYRNGFMHEDCHEAPGQDHGIPPWRD